MTGFEDREKGYERKFERDQEIAFKARARRNHLFGLWAAAQLGLDGAAAEAFARDIVTRRASDEQIVAQVVSAFAAKGVPLDAVRVRMELDRCAAEARKQLGVAP